MQVEANRPIPVVASAGDQLLEYLSGTQEEALCTTILKAEATIRFSNESSAIWTQKDAS